MTVLSISVLGRLQISAGENLLNKFESNKARALLAYLAVEMNQPHSRERLAELLWPESAPRSGFGNLRYALADVRRVIGETAASPPRLLVSRDMLQFNSLSSHSLDVVEFIRLLESREFQQLKQAAALYRDEFLAGFPSINSNPFDEWLLLKREQFRQRLLETLSAIISQHANCGEYEAALPFARRQVELEPWLEEAHQQLIYLLALSGQQSAALAQYETCRRVLARELEVEPSRETVRLYEAIRSGKLSTPSPILRLTHTEPAGPPVVGRQSELDQLDGFLAKALVGDGQVVFITGSPGSGKTALASEFLRRTASAHSQVLMAAGNCNAYTGIGDPYLPFIEIIQWLAADCEAKQAGAGLPARAARQLIAALPVVIQALSESAPDLIDRFVPGQALLERARSLLPAAEQTQKKLETLLESRRQYQDREEPQQTDLFEQVTRFLWAVARQYPLILFIDDLQWADRGSVSLLFHLGKRLAGRRLLVLGAFRPEDIDSGPDGSRPPLATLVNEFVRDFGEMRINLDQSEGRAFVEALIDSEPNCLGAPFREALYQRTNGHPLFTVELLRGLQERAELARNAAGQWIEASTPDWERLPPRVDAVIAERIGRLPENLKALLDAASVEGEVFTADAVAQACGLDVEAVIHLLSGPLCKKHNLIRVEGRPVAGLQAAAQYRFRHFLFQKYLYQQLDEIERPRLHLAIGNALESLSHGSDDLAVQLARHFTQAVPADQQALGKAIVCLLKAGDRARILYAHTEAVAHYEQALQLIRSTGDDESEARLSMKLGIAYHNAFEYERAHQVFDQGFHLWQRAALRTDHTRTEPQTLRMNWLPVTSIDPAFAWDIPGAATWQLFSGMVIFSPGLDILPDMAVKWDISGGGREYVFHLRAGLRWSDGQSLTANDFEYSGKRMLVQKSGSPCANLLYDIEGARDFHKGNIHDPEAIGLKALDPQTLLIRLEKPAPYFLQLLANFLPVPRHCIERHGDQWTEPEHIVTHGPYRLEAWDKNAGMRLVRDPDYHAGFTGNVQHVELVFSTDPFEQLELYAAGRLDLVDMLFYPSAAHERAMRQFSGEYFSFPRAMIHFLGFDVTRLPFNDRRVRRAFALAVDKAVLAGRVQKNTVFPATGGFVPPGLPGHSAGIALPSSAGQARQALAQAGYADGQGFPKIRAVTHLNLENPVNHYLSARWLEVLGVEVRFEPAAPWLPLTQDDNPPDIFLSHWFGDYPDPDDFLGASQLRSWTGWQDEDFINLLEETRRITDQSRRLELYAQADRLLAEAAAIVPLTYDRQHLLLKPWVKRYPTSPLYNWFWKDVLIEAH